MTWEQLYNLLGIKDFIYFISSPNLQDALFPVKLVFVAFSMFFLAAIIYFMLNSSWLQYKFLEDVTEFFSWQPYGAREFLKRWGKIKKRLESNSESEYKLAIIEADDFFQEALEEAGYGGETFEESINNSGRVLASYMEDILKAHQARNSVVYEPDFKLNLDFAKKIIGIYESAIKMLS